ncbi:MAG: MFS transporter [Bradyrhizobiaceae bacterium]|nr:MFS transporter [Bradyrhizobiaceae bacterium]
MQADKPLTRPVTKLGIWGWVMFDWACQPFFTLVTTFVYAPYFASVVVGDPARGQALWGFAAGFAGLLIALFSPVLGAVADATGRRKPWIASFGILLIVGSWALWYGRPGDAETVSIVLVAFVVASVGVEFATVFNNSMMPTLVPPERLGRLSGLGWGMGYVGGLVSLVLTLGFLAASPETGRTLLGFEPLFGLDPAQHEGDRASGPLSTLWFVVFVLPLLLFTPDGRKAMNLGSAARVGLQTFVETVRGIRGHANSLIFLLANMIYANGLGALFAFGGIYAAGMLGWGTIEIGVFGILITIAASIGALLGGRADDALGSKTVILGSLILLIVMSVSILSVDRSTVFFVVPVQPAEPGAGLFTTLPEQLYVAFGAVIGIAAGPLQASSRTLLARLAPRDQLGQFYGLFALSGKLTSFAGPFAVATVTAMAASQRAGISVLVAFFATGALLLLFVRVSAGSDGRR